MRKIGIFTAAFCSAFSAFAGENLILNGGFDGAASQAAWGGYANSAGFSCANWTFNPIGAAGLGRPDGTWIASGLPVGDFGIFLQAGSQDVAVSQTIASLPAGWYRVAFKYTARPGHNPCNTQIYLGDVLVGTVNTTSTALSSFQKDLYFEGGENVVYKFLSTNCGADRSNCFDDAQLRRLDAAIGDAHYLDIPDALAHAGPTDVITYATTPNGAEIVAGTYVWNAYSSKVVVPGTCVVNGTVTILPQCNEVGTHTLIEAGDFDFIEGGAFALDPSVASQCSLAVVGNQLQLTVTDLEPVYARYVDGVFNYLTRDKFPAPAPVGGMNSDITILFSSDAEFQGLKTVPAEVAKAKGLELEANITLAADADWSDFDYSLAGHAIDINGKHFTTGSLSGGGGITSDGNNIANGGFEENAIANGGYVVMTPNGWKTSGTVALIKNNHDHGDSECNGSNWCMIWNGGYIYREFTVVQPADYTLRFDVASRNSSSWWNSGVYAGVDDQWVINQRTGSWNSSTKTFNIPLQVGTHTLKIGCNDNSAIIVDNVQFYKTSNSGTPGILEVKVPEGRTLANDTVTLGGGNALQLWKTGAGELVMNKVNNGFGSPFGHVSTVVKEGVLRKSHNGATCGTQYATIEVDDGGTFDLNGRAYWDYYYILNGHGADGKGALVNTTAESSPWASGNYGYLRDVNIGSDTTISGTQSFGMSFWQHGATTMTMNDHTVHYGGTVIYFGNQSYAGRGRIVIDEGCTMEVYNNSPSAAGCTLEVNGQLQQHDVALSLVSNLIFTATGKFRNAYDTRPMFTVSDTYAPNLNTAQDSHVQHPTLTLGTANSLYTRLDLSRFTDTFDSTSTTFYPNSSITVELGSRTLVAGQKIVAWTTRPVFADIAASGTNLGGIRLTARDDGLYAVAAPAWAEWNIDNGCWQYFTATGEQYPMEWEDGITGEIDVHFSSLAEFNAIKALGVSPAKFVLTKLELPAGTGLYDFSNGFDFVIPPNTVIDLKGNRLKLPAANIGGAVPFTVTDSGAPTDLIANGSLEQYNGTVGNSGAWNYLSGGVSFKNWTGAASAGITKANTPWTNVTTLPDGTYACFMQNSSELKQTFAVSEDGTYVLDFWYAARPGHTGARFATSIDGEEKLVISGVGSTVFAEQQLPLPLTAGSHELRFSTSLINSGDQGTLVDKVVLRRSGELIVDVPAGTTIANNNVAITGPARVVKQGAGTFTANRSQNYTGSTLVAGGQLTLGNNTCLGGKSEVRIDANGTLELNAKGDVYNYTFVLNGGVLQNTAGDVGSGTAQIANMRLMADSTFRPTTSYGLIGSGYAATKLDLGGHTLTVPIGVGKNFWLYNATVTAGTVDITSGGWLAVDKTAVNAGSATFRVACALNLAVPFTVGGYEARYGGDYNAGAGVMTVNNVFKPVSNFYRGVTLANGATIDFSEFTGVLGAESTFKDAKTAMVYPTGTEEAPATVYVELHGRHGGSSQLIAWDAIPANLKFECTPRTQRDCYTLYTRSNGLFVRSGVMVFVR